MPDTPETAEREQQSKQVSLPASSLKASDFEKDQHGHLVVKNTKIADLLSSKLAQQPTSRGAAAAVKVSVSVDF